jgi:short-subunit dehydrogenase
MAELKFPAESPLLRRKRAIVVGASSGIGAALSKKLAKEGYRVALLARRKKALNGIEQDINEISGETRAISYPHDVTKYKTIPALFHQILSDFETVDALIYVSGAMTKVGQSEFDFEKEKSMLDVNLYGAIAWMDQLAPFFESLKGGQIVGISSVAGDRGRVGNPVYNTSKAGLNTYLEALRNRLTRHGINVLTVKPGFVKTVMLEGAATTMGAISPEQAADEIWKGMRKKKSTIYTPGWWKWLMMAISHTPSFIFRRLNF